MTLNDDYAESLDSRADMDRLLVDECSDEDGFVGFERLTERVRQALKRLKGSIVQDCPPELYACEVCKKLECNNEEWLHCEKRLEAAEFMKSFGKPRPRQSLPDTECPHQTEASHEPPVSSASNAGKD